MCPATPRRIEAWIPVCDAVQAERIELRMPLAAQLEQFLGGLRSGFESPYLVGYYGASFTYRTNRRSGISIMAKRPSDIPGVLLTPREREVADEIMKGSTNKEIAKALGVSYETVKEHVQHILVKYGAPRRELIAIRLLKEELTGEALGKDFVKQFDQMAAAAEQTADELKRQVESMRDLVGTAMRRLSKKGKR